MIVKLIDLIVLLGSKWERMSSLSSADRTKTTGSENVLPVLVNGRGNSLWTGYRIPENGAQLIIFYLRKSRRGKGKHAITLNQDDKHVAQVNQG